MADRPDGVAASSLCLCGGSTCARTGRTRAANEACRSFDRRRSGVVFAALADLLREFGEANGMDVYVSTNTRSVTLDRQRPGRGEYDVHIKVRGDGA